MSRIKAYGFLSHRLESVSMRGRHYQRLTVVLAKHLQLTGQMGEINKKAVHRVRREVRNL
jgi:hypothetical protein